MKPNELYFYRNRGPWDWRVELSVRWSRLWRSDLPLFSKLSFSALSLVQRILGPLQMHTFVAYRESSGRVGHATRMTKWGITLYRSEKTFVLAADGTGLRIEGREFYWPLGFIGILFTPTEGAVDTQKNHASYEMPMSGTRCRCRAFLEPGEGFLEVEEPWLSGRFTLREESMERLRRRFGGSGAP